ncbi:ribosomal protein S18-alanine N-acetyltransferase [soil metagenome]
MNFTLHTAGPADVADIMLLENSTFGSDAWSPSMMLADLSQPHCYYLVATAEGSSDLRGYAGLLSPHGAPDADIQTIAVAPDARRHGLGRQLMNALVAEAARRRARRVFLEVRADNPGAQHLYDTLGFAPIGVRRGYYQPDNVDAIVMRLDLPRSPVTTEDGATGE